MSSSASRSPQLTWCGIEEELHLLRSPVLTESDRASCWSSKTLFRVIVLASLLGFCAPPLAAAGDSESPLQNKEVQVAVIIQL
jgi:anti-sigma-K factor RskA